MVLPPPFADSCPCNGYIGRPSVKAILRGSEALLAPAGALEHGAPPVHKTASGPLLPSWRHGKSSLEKARKVIFVAIAGALLAAFSIWTLAQAIPLVLSYRAGLRDVGIENPGIL